jgi:hypothetical protein
MSTHEWNKPLDLSESFAAMHAAKSSPALGHCCYGGIKPRSDCASCGCWKPITTTDIWPLWACEVHKLTLRMGQTYVLMEHEGCEKCKAMGDAARVSYGANAGAPAPQEPHAASHAAGPDIHHLTVSAPGLRIVGVEVSDDGETWRTAGPDGQTGGTGEPEGTA